MKPTTVIFVGLMFYILIGVILVFNDSRKHKTVEPDYVSDINVIPEGDYTSTINIPEGVTCIILYGIRKIKINKSNDYSDDIDFPDSEDQKMMIYENTTENSGLLIHEGSTETVEQYLRRLGIEKGLMWFGDGDNGN